MDKNNEDFDPDNTVIKEEPLNNDTYGIMSQESSGNLGPHTDNCTPIFECYPKREPECFSDHSDVKSSFNHGRISSGETDDYDAMSRSYANAGTSLEGISDEKGQREEVTSEEDTFQIVCADDYFDEAEGAEGSVTEDPEDSEHDNLSYDADDRTGIHIKEERVDPEYEFSYIYTNDYARREQLPEESSVSDQNSVYTDQPESTENSSEGICGDVMRETNPCVSKRTRQIRHKAKRRDSFEYDENFMNEEASDSVSSSHGSEENEFEVYMDTDREPEEGEKVEEQDFSQNVTPGCEEQSDHNMIAQYAIFDPEKSEMVGIKSVNPKKCHICDKEFQYEFHKKFHMQQVHPDSLEKDQRKNEQEVPLWRKMQEQNHARARYSKTCFICMNKIYTHPYYLNLHMQEIHPEWLIDNKMIQNLIADDEVEKTTPENKKKACPVCSEGFRFAFQLKYHIQKRHAEILVEDKRVDTSKLPSRCESEIPIEDFSSVDELEPVNPSGSASSGNGIKLTYTVKDLLNIKRNVEKEKATKVAKAAQRLAKNLKPKKKPGRPRKPPDERKVNSPHLSGTSSQRRRPGRPRKNHKAPTENHVVKGLEVSEVSSGEQDKSEGSQGLDCQKDARDGGAGVDGDDNLVSRDTNLEFSLNLSESSSKISEGEQKRSTEGRYIVENDNEHVERPRRKRKIKKLEDLLPQNKKKMKKVEREQQKEPTSNIENRICKTDTNSKTSKNSTSSLKQVSSPKATHIPAQQYRFCSSCGKIFTNSRTFEDHEPGCLSAAAAQGSTGYYPCQKCPVVFQHVAAHQLHVLRDHLDSSKTCPFCGKLFAYPSVMKKHMYIHTNEAVRKVITAVKNEKNTEEEGNNENDLKLVGLISNLEAQGHNENQGGTLELSVPLKPVSDQMDSFLSLPKVCSSEETMKTKKAKGVESGVKGDGILLAPTLKNTRKSVELKSQSESPDSSYDVTDIRDASPVVSGNLLPYATLKQALSKPPQHQKRSSSVSSSAHSSSSSDLSVCDSSCPVTTPQDKQFPTLTKLASKAVASLQAASDICSSGASNILKPPFPLHSKIASLLLSPSPLSFLTTVPSPNSVSSESVVPSLSISSSSSNPEQKFTFASNDTSVMSVAAKTGITVSPLSSGKVSIPTTAFPAKSITSSKKSPSLANQKSVIPSNDSITVTSLPNPSGVISSLFSRNHASRSHSSKSQCNPSPSSSVDRSRKSYPCKVCNEEFPDVAFLYKHEIEQHLKSVVPQCIWCGRPFIYVKGLKNHLLIHNGTEIRHKLNCSKCSKHWYDTKGQLPGDMKDVIEDHLEDCFADCSDMEDMLMNYMYNVNKNKSQKCIECNKSYKLNSSHSWNVHIDHVYRCKVCDGELHSIDHLKDHVYEHHDEAQGLVSGYKRNRTFNCGSCSEKFNGLFEFMCHLTAHKKAILAQKSDKTD